MRPVHSILSSIVTLLFATTGPAVAATGPQTEPVDAQDYKRVLYVSSTTGSDEKGNGTRNAPWASLTHALENARGRTVALLVSAGSYGEHSLAPRKGLHLYGGFNAGDWSRDIEAHRSVIDASGEGRILIAADDLVLDGFEIRGGTIRDAGGAVYIDGTSPTLSNNTFIANKTQGPENWAPQHWHETAHDGGAIYCTGGGSPTIRNNLVVGNRTENGRGAGIAYDNECGGTIKDNVLAGNVAGTDDPMRSSDGGAISIFRWSSPDISGNVVLGNAALNRNDAGGIFVALWSSPTVRDNLIVGNAAGDDAGGLFVGGQEHRYDAPLDPLPDEDSFFVEVTGNRFFGNTNSSRNSGATRITMESRGRVANNVAALNPGFYLQRSELDVVNNTILENTLLIETKDGLRPTRFRDNVVLGAFDPEPVAEISGNLLSDGSVRQGNTVGEPVFLDDGLLLRVVAANGSAAHHQSTLRLAKAPGVALENRVVRSGDRWGVVRSVSGNTLTVWGDLSSAAELSVLPTYRQSTSSPGFGKGADAERATAGYRPGRINKSIELLEDGQPIYYAAGYGGYEKGLAMADTWADYIVYNMEHQPLDFAALRAFMRGLVDAGPTPSGHRTPTVIVVLPLLGLDEETVKSGGWMVEQALAQGVHGVHLARARDPAAVARFVQAARYPIHEQASETLGIGLRGWGSHIFAAWVWGLEREDYLRKADVWPLNPEGEIMLGVKIEDQQALERAEETLAVPGLAFAEHGPRDLGLSYGYLEGRADPPLPQEVNEAGDYVLDLTVENGLYFLDNVLPDNVVDQIERGVMIGAGRREDAAEVGRAHSQRNMPW